LALVIFDVTLSGVTVAPIGGVVVRALLAAFALWVAYHALWQTAGQLTTDGDRLRWQAALRRGEIALADVTAVAPRRSWSLTAVIECSDGRHLYVAVQKGFAPFIEQLTDLLGSVPVRVGSYGCLAERIPGPSGYTPVVSHQNAPAGAFGRRPPSGGQQLVAADHAARRRAVKRVASDDKSSPRAWAACSVALPIIGWLASTLVVGVDIQTDPGGLGLAGNWPILLAGAIAVGCGRFAIRLAHEAHRRFRVAAPQQPGTWMTYAGRLFGTVVVVMGVAMLLFGALFALPVAPD
jgi:hypothetical protein